MLGIMLLKNLDVSLECNVLRVQFDTNHATRFTPDYTALWLRVQALSAISGEDQSDKQTHPEL